MSDNRRSFIENLDWQKEGGLLPVVVEDTAGKVLTLAYMNREALEKTLETGYAHYYSRSKKRIRRKGEVSGNVQKVVSLKADCDNDALLMRVEQTGNACHTGHYSCFYNSLENGTSDKADEMDYSLNFLKELEALIGDRKEKMPPESYTTQLFREGREKIYKKFGEEAVEVLVAENHESLVYELGDLLYHMLVLTNYNDVSLDEIVKELKKRHGK